VVPVTDRWLCTVCGAVDCAPHEHRRHLHDPSTRFGENVPLLPRVDRDALEDVRERLAGIYRRTSQVETRLALETVIEVLDRDDHPTIVADLTRTPVCPDGGVPAGSVHHHRALGDRWAS
jgi:hypothetical protein